MDLIKMARTSAASVFSSFSWRRSRVSAIVWSLILAFYTYAKVVGYAKAYSTQAQREQFAVLMAKTTGLNVIVGPANNLQSVGGYTVWATYVIMLVLGSIWAILTVTKNTRGDEQEGRFDVALSGRLKLSSFTFSIFNGLLKSLVLFGLILAIFMVGLSKVSGVDINATALLIYALVICAGIGLFMTLSLFSAQLMPTRRSALGLAMGFLGLSFILKALGDTTSLKWMLDTSPLGWFEKLSPIQNTHYVWLVPIGLLALVAYSSALWVASKRDLNESWIKDNLSARSHLRLLGSLPAMALRFGRGTIITWGLIMASLGLFYGLLTKSAVAAISSSSGYLNAINHLSSGALMTATGAYVSAVFFINMILFTLFTASVVSNFKREELSGHDSNVLIQPVSRTRYLGSKVVLQIIGLVCVSIVTSLSFWAGAALTGNHIIGSVSLITAGLNAAVPALLVLAAGTLVFGRLPRASVLVCYAIIVWSVMINLVSSGLNINHYLKDVSVFSSIKLAPALTPDWQANLELAVVCLAVITLGGYLYKRRDLAND
jgi:ABC-2 type transport system permease protein